MDQANFCQFEKPELLGLAFKMTRKRDSLVLTFQGPSMYFLELFDLKAVPSLKPIETNYRIVHDNYSKITFERVEEEEGHWGFDLPEELNQVLKRFKVCVMHYAAISQRQTNMTLDRLKEKVAGLMVKKIPSPKFEHSGQIIIYYPRQFHDILEYTIEDFQRFESLELLFPLNWFIKPEVHSYLNFKFVEEIARQYSKEIKCLPKKKKIKNLKVLTVEPSAVERSHRTREWTKGENGGIYGLLMKMEGLDYEIFSFYSALETFFSRKDYCVKTLETALNCSQESLEENYFKKKYDNRMVKYLPLDKHQIVVIGPPEHFKTIKDELSKVFWSINSSYFPNLDFQLFKKKEHFFKRFLKQRSIEWQDLLISQQAFTFYADKINYEKIRYHSRIFLIDHIQEEIRLQFIDGQQKLQIFKEFTMKNIPLEDVELFWREGYAFCRCLTKQTKHIFAQLRDLYSDHKEALRSSIGLRYINNENIMVDENPGDLVPEKYAQWKIDISQLQFSLTIRDYRAGVRNKTAIFMVDSGDDCIQLQTLLGEVKVQNLKKSLSKFSQVMVDNSPLFSSIVFWSTKGGKNETRNSYSQRLFNQLLMIKYKDKTPLVIVVTRQFYRLKEKTIKILIEKIIQSELNYLHQLTLVLSEELSIFEREQFLESMIYFFHQDLREKIKFNYRLPISLLPEICSMRYFSLQYPATLEGRTKTLEATPLNSFIFHSQVSKSKLTKKSVAVVLPKIQNFTELLVNIKTSQVFKVEGVTRELEGGILKQLAGKMARSIQRYFSQQKYIVMYANKMTGYFVSSIFVYSEGQPTRMRKYILDRGDDKFRSTDKDTTFTIEYNDIHRYRYHTHRHFFNQMESIIQGKL